MEAYGITLEQVSEAFRCKRSLRVSPGSILPKSAGDNFYAVTNTGAPRLSGAPLIINGKVCRMITGSLSLPNRFHAVKVAVLAQIDPITALQYIKDNNINHFLFNFSGNAGYAEKLIRSLQMREVEEVKKDKNADLYQESRVGGNEEPLATISKVPDTERKIEESAQEIDLTWEATAQAIIKEKEKRISYEKKLEGYLRLLHREAEDLYNEAYHKYYSKNPNALRYNLCLASSSPYFKAAVLIAKLGKKLTKTLQE